MFDREQFKKISFTARPGDDIRWIANYEYRNYLIEIRTTFELRYWMVKTICKTGIGENIIVGPDDNGQAHYYLEPTVLARMLHEEDVEEYIKNVRDAKDLADFICKNMEKLQKGEIV